MSEYDEELGSSIQEIQNNADADILENMGYKQELKRSFNLLSMIGFSFSILSCWSALAGTLAQIMLNGGPAALIWGWVGCCALSMCVVLCMADLCSAYPTAGGQYSWCLMLAKNTKWGRAVSYYCGWIQLSGLVGMTAVGWYLTGMDVAAIANLNYPDFIIKNWIVALIAYGAGIMAFVISLYGVKILAHISDAALYWSIGGFIICTVVILACAPQYESASFVFTSTITDGWPSNKGISIILGILQPAFGIATYDSVAHLAEETENAPKQCPRAMVMAVLIGFITGFVFVVALLFCIQDLDAVINTPTGFPLVEIFRQATNSNAGATCLSVIIIVAQLFTNISLLTESSRSVYAFARDGAFPFRINQYLMRVSPTLDVPVFAMIVVAAISAGLVAILFGSSTAFFTVVSIATTGLYISYFLCVFVYLLCTKRKTRGYYNLDKWAPWMQIPACIYLVFCIIFMFFPTTMPVNASNMNYNCIAIGIIFALAVFSWVCGAGRSYSSEIGCEATVIEAIKVPLSDNNDAEKPALKDPKYYAVL